MAELTVKSKFFAMEDKVEVVDSEISKAVVDALDGQDVSVNDLSLEGDLTGDGDIAVSGRITAGEIVENMSGYSFVKTEGLTEVNYIYAGVCKNGNKITFVLFGTYTKKAEEPTVNPTLGKFNVPQSVYEKLYPYNSWYLDDITISYSSSPSASKVVLPGVVTKRDGCVVISAYSVHTSSLTAETPYLFRVEVTFLLSDNLAGE